MDVKQRVLHIMPKVPILGRLCMLTVITLILIMFLYHNDLIMGLGNEPADILTRRARLYVKGCGLRDGMQSRNLIINI